MATGRYGGRRYCERSRSSRLKFRILKFHCMAEVNGEAVRHSRSTTPRAYYLVTFHVILCSLPQFAAWQRTWSTPTYL
ncbi:hypothetical protein BJX61DRAFT_280565 [Aspergillus egyptiacus]|nr:hypothetical protein BJX61DRAFT_280565 [Aspergillus egyptiacus]